MKSIYKLIVLSISLTVLGCENSKSETKTERSTSSLDNQITVSKNQFKQNSMAFGHIEEQTFSMGIKVNGIIDVPPQNKAVVNAITGGYIRTIPLLVGDVVKKGQVLVSIENPEFVQMQQNYMEVKEQLNYLKTEFERQNEMYNENIISKKVFLKAKSEYKTTLAKYNGLKKQLTLVHINTAQVEKGHITSVVNIYAPISGSITKVNVTKGAYVSPTTSILEIIDNEHIHIELSVFEKDIMTIKKDQQILFSIPESSDKTYEAKVYLVGTAIEANRTIKVHGHPNDDDQNFLTGMFVNAEIITDTSLKMTLPETAIINFEDANYVLVLEQENDADFYFKQLKVDIGKTSNGYTELKDTTTLKKTDTIVTQGAFSLIGN
ncbi:MAG: efflux RND transporter periplasmic adaptor subunit [Winogradskyella sp.]